MQSMPWFRYYSETPNDRKLKWAAKMAGVNKLTINGAWAIIMSLASESPVRGMLLVTFQERFSVTNIAEEFDIDVETTQKILDALISFGMLAVDDQGVFYLPNWQKRQFESDTSTPRVKKHRENKKIGDETPDETLQKRFGNGPEADTEADTEAEVVGEKTPAPAASRSADPQALKVFTSLTGMVVYPASETAKCEEAMNGLAYQHPVDLQNYLQPFWDAWRARKYSKSNCAWLYDWAVSGEIPPDKRKPGTGLPIAVAAGYSSAPPEY